MILSSGGEIKKVNLKKIMRKLMENRSLNVRDILVSVGMCEDALKVFDSKIQSSSQHQAIVYAVRTQNDMWFEQEYYYLCGIEAEIDKILQMEDESYDNSRIS